MNPFYKQGQIEALHILGLLKTAAPPPAQPKPPPPPPITGGKGRQIDALRREGVML